MKLLLIILFSFICFSSYPKNISDKEELIIELKKGEDILVSLGAKQRIQAFKIRKKFEINGIRKEALFPLEKFILLLKKNEEIPHVDKNRIVGHYKKLLKSVDRFLLMKKSEIKSQNSTIKSLNRKIDYSKNKPNSMMSFTDIKVFKLKKWFYQNWYFILVWMFGIIALLFSMKKRDSRVEMKAGTQNFFSKTGFGIEEQLEKSITPGVNLKEFLEEKLVLKESFVESKQLDDIFVHSVGLSYYMGDLGKLESLLDELIISITTLKSIIEKSCDIKIIGGELSQSIEISFNNYDIDSDEEFKQIVVNELFNNVEKNLYPLSGNLNFRTRKIDGILEFIIMVDFRIDEDYSNYEKREISP